ncbi:hypothetical protein GCM10008018_67450 [Paenibacillus marchantiophytorum]|uniref:Uncharacterized protein n=1 Tax=Paenibacillus marchantiophytorum TaxID=1619310 RepID=A0ABQ1FH85_9BACL|nr:hypothetical protein GCM10008018_67450 [Paenibacillus marchantiophytorum]
MIITIMTLLRAVAGAVAVSGAIAEVVVAAAVVAEIKKNKGLTQDRIIWYY